MIISNNESSFRPLVKFLNPLIRTVLFWLLCVFLGSCTNPEYSVEAWNSRISQDLPLGSAKASVASYLAANSLSLTDNVATPLPDANTNSRVFRRASTSIDVPDSFLFRNRKLIFDFYFDDDDRLISFKILETYASL